MVRAGTLIKKYPDIAQASASLPEPWDLTIYQNEDNLCYRAIHLETRELLWVDPVLEDWDLLIRQAQETAHCRTLAVIDTHTHADHLSCAGQLACHLGVPLIMHQRAPASGVSLRVCSDTSLSTVAGPLEFITAPGHTTDGIVIIWGPLVFTGDTILYSDTGRNDLPTGNVLEHFQTIEKLREKLRPDQLVLPGHDDLGRSSTWAHQLITNASLVQSREDFIRDASAFTGAAPRLFKQSITYNSR